MQLVVNDNSLNPIRSDNEELCRWITDRKLPIKKGITILVILT